MPSMVGVVVGVVAIRRLARRRPGLPLVSPLVVVSFPLPRADAVDIHHPPYGQALVGVAWVPCHSAVSSPSSPGSGVGTPAGVVAISPPSHSTHQPPREQLLVRLGAGGVSL